MTTVPKLRVFWPSWKFIASAQMRPFWELKICSGVFTNAITRRFISDVRFTRSKVSFLRIHIFPRVLIQDVLPVLMELYEYCQELKCTFLLKFPLIIFILIMIPEIIYKCTGLNIYNRATLLKCFKFTSNKNLKVWFVRQESNPLLNGISNINMWPSVKK